MPKNARGQRKAANLSIEQLEAIAKYLGYSLVCVPGSVSLYDRRSTRIVKRDRHALDHIRSIYTERALGALADIPSVSVGA
jgi:hypothetical protein